MGKTYRHMREEVAAERKVLFRDKENKPKRLLKQEPVPETLKRIHYEQRLHKLLMEHFDL